MWKEVIIKEIKKYGSFYGSDIKYHIPKIYDVVMKKKPSLVVELGAEYKGGRIGSTSVFLLAKENIEFNLISVDVEDIEHLKKNPNLMFVNSSSVKFGNEFEKFCEKKNLNPKIDILFIDSLHHPEYTIKEFDVWIDYLSDNGVIILHDTNFHDDTKKIMFAINKYFGTDYDPSKEFKCDINDEWSIEHTPESEGLAILRRNKND